MTARNPKPANDKPLAAAVRAMGGYATVASIGATNLIMVLSTFVVWKLAILNWGAEQLGDYLVARRVINVVQLPLICITQLGLVRFGAIAVAQRDTLRIRCLQVSSVVLAVVLSLSVLFVMNAWPELCEQGLFGMSGHQSLVTAISVAIAGMLLHSVVWSQLWVHGSVHRASLLQMAVLTTPAIWMFLWPSLDVSRTVLATGLTWVLVHAVLIVIQLKGSFQSMLPLAEIRQATRQLLQFGLPRVPGGVSAAALFSVPVILAAHDQDALAATYVGTGVALLTMTATMIKPFTLAVLSTASKMLATNDAAVLRRAVIQFGVVGGALATLFVVVVQLLLPGLLTWYLGDEFLAGISVLRILLFAILPYSLFILLRDFLDAMDVRPINTRNLLIALTVFLAIGIAGDGPVQIALALTAALSILAVLSIVDAAQALRRVTSTTATTDAPSLANGEARYAA